MSFKGHTFTDTDAPRGVRQRGGEVLKAWIEEQTEKNRVVAECPSCKRPLVTGEALPHRLNHSSNGNVRAAAGMVLRLLPDEIAEVLEIVSDLT